MALTTEEKSNITEFVEQQVESILDQCVKQLAASRGIGDYPNDDRYSGNAYEFDLDDNQYDGYAAFDFACESILKYAGGRADYPVLEKFFKRYGLTLPEPETVPADFLSLSK